MRLGRDVAFFAIIVMILSRKVVGNTAVSLFVTITLEISFCGDFQKLPLIGIRRFKALDVNVSETKDWCIGIKGYTPRTKVWFSRIKGLCQGQLSLGFGVRSLIS